jgi:hypothetical protein
MQDVLPELDHVTPEWLTEVLQDQGHLADGRVTAVHLKTIRPTAISLVAHLEGQYTDDISVSLPSQLFLKTSRPDLIVNFPYGSKSSGLLHPDCRCHACASRRALL